MDTSLETLHNVTNGDIFLELSYLVAAIMFVIGLKMLSHPESARKGNLWAGAGMVLAMATTLFLHRDDAGQGIAVVALAALRIGL